MHTQLSGGNLSVQKDIIALVGGKASVSGPTRVPCPQQSNHPMAMLQEFPAENPPNPSSRKKMCHMPFLLSTSEVGLERNSRSWATILKMRALLGKATSYSEPRSQNLGSEIKNKLCLQKMGPKADFQVLETPHYSHRSIIPVIPE